MNPELLQRLDAIAAKIGAAAGTMWPLLVRRALIGGIRDTVIGILLVLGSRWAWCKLAAHRKAEAARAYGDEIGPGLGMVCVAIAAVVGVCLAAEGIVCATSPEAEALRWWLLGQVSK